jgi:hypothetical protein
MRQWLARLSFGLLIAAGVLFWDARRSMREDAAPRPKWRITTEFVASGACLVLAFAGLRIRRMNRD